MAVLNPVEAIVNRNQCVLIAIERMDLRFALSKAI